MKTKEGGSYFPPTDIVERVLELSRDLICVAGFDGYFKYVNPTFEEALGYTPEELKATPYIEFVHPDDRPATKAAAAACARGIDAKRFENRYRSKDGFYHSLQWWTREAPKDQLIYAMARDVTEETKYIEELKKAYRERDLILNSIGDGVHGLDIEGRITFLNAAALQMHGWKREDFIGQRAHDRIYRTKANGEPFPAKDCPIYATLRDGVLRRVKEDVFWRENGTTFPVEYVSAPLRDENGAIAGGVLTFRDIRERKEAEAALRNCEAQYRALFEVNPSPMWVSDPETGEIFDVNAAAIRRYGYSREEFLRSGLPELGPTEEEAWLPDSSDEAKSPARYEGRRQHLTKDGELVIAAVYTALIRFNNRSARMTLAIDLTA